MTSFLITKDARPDVLDCFYETIFTLPSDNPITSGSTDPVINLPSSPQTPKHVYKERVKGKCFDCESLRTQNEHLNQLIIDLQGEKAELHNTVKRLNRQRLVDMNEHTQELIKQQRKINVSDEIITKLKSDLKNNNEKNSRAVNQLQSENADLMEKVEENRSKKKELKSEIKGLKEDLSDLNKKNCSKSVILMSVSKEKDIMSTVMT